MMEDLKHPLYEWTQVITHEELHDIAVELEKAVTETPWYRFKDRLMLLGALNSAAVMLMWLHSSKPSSGFNVERDTK